MENNASVKSSVLAWSATFLVFTGFVLVVLYGRARETIIPPEPPKILPNVEVATIKPQEYREKLILPVRITADRSGAVSAEISGILRKWLVEEGEEATEGQVVAELDSQFIDANLNELLAKKRSASLSVSLSNLEVEQAKTEEENAFKVKSRLELDQKSAQAALNLATSEFNRIETLNAKGVLKRSDLDSAENALIQAEVGVERAKEGLSEAIIGVQRASLGIERARKNVEMSKASLAEIEAGIASIQVTMGKLKLRAPVSGKLEKHLVETGEIASAEKPVAYVYDLKNMRAIVEVPDRYIIFFNEKSQALKAYIAQNSPGARQGVFARVILSGLPKLTGGKAGEFSIEAEVARVAQAAAPGSNTFEVELRFSNPDGVLKHGIIANCEIDYLTFPSAIVVPLTAVKATDEGPMAMVVEKINGREIAAARSIDPASVREDKLLILNGLSGGDRLITAGWKGLMPGEEVRIIVEDGAILKNESFPAK